MNLKAICLMAVMELAGGAAVFGADLVDFASQIQPVFIEHCGKCHGETKQQGKLRLTSIAGIQAKLATEPQLLVAGKPDESELFQRLVLPDTNRKRMPKQADPLAAETIAMIRAWIEQGADLAANHGEAASGPAPGTDNVVTAGPETSTAAQQPLPDVPAAAAETIAKLQAGGAYVMPLYLGSPLLEVSYALRGQPAGDRELELLENVAEQLFSLNLKGAQASETGYASLAKFAHLRRLHLELSSITDSALQHVARLESLEYLNLYGTQISDAGLPSLKSLAHLRSLYLWQTHVSYEAAMELAAQIGPLDVNLGHDHPIIMQQRLTAEIDSVGKQLTELKAEEEAAQRQLDLARTRKELLQTRLTELESSLKQLTEPSEEKNSAHPTDTPTGKSGE